jgi:hypothetical protein|tara:strand:- start:1368 stop:1574 length:207 start_codon:yes stop_codon:yes gene_type:complete
MDKDGLFRRPSREAELRNLEFARVEMDYDMMTASNEEEVEYIKYKRTELDERIEHLRREMSIKEPSNS